MNENLNLILTSSAVSAIIAFSLGWVKEFFNEKKQELKRLQKIRENSYQEVMKNIDFIYNGKDVEVSITKKNDFLKNYRMMFLYSKDEVVRSINNILEILENNNEEDEQMRSKKDEIGSAMIALRMDIVKNTKLKKVDFKHVI